MSVLKYVLEDRERVQIKMDIPPGAYPHVPPVDEHTLELVVKTSPHIQNVPDAKIWRPKTKTTVECKERAFDSQRIVDTIKLLRSDEGITCDKISRDGVLQRRSIHVDASLLRVAYQPSIKGVSVESCIYLDHMWNIRSADHLIESSQLQKPQPPKFYDANGNVLEVMPPIEFDDQGHIKKSVFTKTKRAVVPPDPHEDAFIVIGTRTMNRFLRFKSKRQANELILTMAYLRYLAIQRTKGVSRLRDLWVATDDSSLGTVVKSNVYCLLDRELGTRPVTDDRRRVEETFSITQHNFYLQFDGTVRRGDGEIGYSMFCDLLLRLFINRQLAILYNELAQPANLATNQLSWKLLVEPKVSKKSLPYETFEKFIKDHQKKFVFSDVGFATQQNVAGINNNITSKGLLNYKGFWKHNGEEEEKKDSNGENLKNSQQNSSEIDFPTFWGALMDSELNSWANTDLPLDETLTLRSYIVNASHNTYITGPQMNTYCDVDGYAIALHTGARFVELDVWEGKNVHFAAGSRKLRGPEVTIDRVLGAIKETAFVHSDLPVIITIENFIQASEAQKALAQDVRKILSDPHRGVDLVTVDNGNVLVDGKSINLNDAQLKSLKRKFIVMMKPTIQLVAAGGSDDGLNIEDQFSETRGAIALAIYGDKARAEQEDSGGLSIGDSLSNAIGVSKLAPILKQTEEAYKKKASWTEPTFIGLAAMTHSLSSELLIPSEKVLPTRFLTEGTIERSTNQAIKKHVEVAMSKFTCVYPSMGRYDSSNLDPIKMWASGAQVAAINFQTWDLSMHINASKFEAYGRRGYVPKQVYYRSRDFSPPTDRSPLHRLQIELLCGQQFPKMAVKTQSAFARQTRPFVRLCLHDSTCSIRFTGSSFSNRINTGTRDGDNPLIYGFGAEDVANMSDSDDLERKEGVAAAEALKDLCDTIRVKLERVNKLEIELGKAPRPGGVASSPLSPTVQLPPAPQLAKCEIEVLEHELEEVVTSLSEFSKALLAYNVTFDEKSRLFRHDTPRISGITGWESIVSSITQMANDEARKNIREELSYNMNIDPLNCLTPFFGGKSCVFETRRVEEAVLVIEIIHLDKFKTEDQFVESELLAAEPVAVAAVPLVALRGGYRCVQFRDAVDGHALPYTTLLCNFTNASAINP